MNNNAAIDQSSGSAKAGRILRRRWQKAAALNQWSQVITIFESVAGSILSDRDLLWYARACIRQKNHPSLQRACELAFENNSRPHIVNAITHEMRINGVPFSKFGSVNEVIRAKQNDLAILRGPQENYSAAIDREQPPARKMLSIESRGSSPTNTRKIPREFSSAVFISGSQRVPQEIFGVFRKMDRDILRFVDHLETPEIYEFSNVFTNRFGQIWDYSGRVLKGPKYLAPPTLAGLTNTSRIKEAGLITSKTKGFFHWYVEKLPAMARLLQEVPSTLPIMFGDHNAHFQDDTIALYPNIQPEIMRIGDAVCVERLLVCEGSIRQLAQRRLNAVVYDPLVAEARRRTNDFSLGKNIYVSRRLASRRKMQNEPELEACLQSLGFAIVRLEEFSVAQQISLFHNAELVVGPHGAGLSHLAAAQPGLKVFEIIPTDISWTLRLGQWSLRFNYARLSRLLGHKHHIWLENSNPIQSQWSVSLNEMLPALQNFAQSGSD